MIKMRSHTKTQSCSHDIIAEKYLLIDITRFIIILFETRVHACNKIVAECVLLGFLAAVRGYGISSVVCSDAVVMRCPLLQ